MELFLKKEKNNLEMTKKVFKFVVDERRFFDNLITNYFIYFLGVCYEITND